MRPLNEVQHWKKELDEASRQAALDTMILAQIQGLEKLMEGNGAHVKSALAYNQCVGLIQQLKHYATACYRPPEQSLDRQIYTEPFKPLHGQP
jgi:hypothetical protein